MQGGEVKTMIRYEIDSQEVVQSKRPHRLLVTWDPGEAGSGGIVDVEVIGPGERRRSIVEGLDDVELQLIAAEGLELTEEPEESYDEDDDDESYGLYDDEDDDDDGWDYGGEAGAAHAHTR